MKPIPNLSLAQQIAQMLVIGFRGLFIAEDAPIFTDIYQRGIGGVVLFDVDVPTRSKQRNIQSPEQVKKLTGQLQAAAAVPLLISVDQEGGQIARLKPAHGFPKTVSHQWLGQQDSPELTRAKSRELAGTLALAGFNLNFAPCVDVNLNPHNPIIGARERSFSPNAQKVVEHASEFVRGHHEAGVLCALKHFPGHGSSRQDSHLGLVDVSATWQAEELVPYQKLIPLGLADAIMTAHVFNAKLDAEFPATLSEKIIGQFLREKLGYDGLVFSDDMQMKAITAHYGLEEAIARAINAGIDMLVFGNNLDYDDGIAARVIDIVLKLVNEGKISASRISESWQRIWAVKMKLTEMRHD